MTKTSIPAAALLLAPLIALQAAEPAPGSIAPHAQFQDKTLVAWVTLANLTQHGGSVLTIDDRAKHVDGIVFGEIAPAKWMAGSERWSRTEQQQDGWPAETADANTLVQIAVAYKGNEITLYRNGEEYVRTRDNTPTRDFVLNPATFNDTFDYAQTVLDVVNQGEGGKPNAPLVGLGEGAAPDIAAKPHLIWENGDRVPLLVRWPGRIEPGERKQFGSAEDVLPTLLDLTAIKADTTPHQPFTGVSLQGSLEDAAADAEHPDVLRMAISGPGSPKPGTADVTQRSFAVHHLTLRGPRFKYHALPGGKVALYDIKTDPGETTDVQAKFPEITAGMAKQCRKRWQAVISSGRSFTPEPAPSKTEE